MKKVCTFFFNAAKIAPLFTAIAAILAVVFAYTNLGKQFDHDNELKAIELFGDYSKTINNNKNFLDISILDSNNNIDTTKISLDYRLFAHYCLFIAESIYNLVGHKNTAWKITVIYILTPHISFYEINNSIDESLEENFREFYINKFRKL